MHFHRLRGLLIGGVAAATLAACYQTSPDPAYPQPSYYYGGYDYEPMVVQGPPGGQIDPGFAYAQPDGPGDAAGGAVAAPEAPEPSSDPSSPGYVMGQVTDEEIDATLAPYGEWEESEEYGRVWRPHATVVGVDFTPYETCGEWVYTDFGWTFQCNDWDWGWLPFHYGNWGWFDDSYWGWVPDYTWGPAWVDWRHGGGFVGWRPTPPRGRSGRVRDYRGSDGRFVRDYRGGDGRFARDYRGGAGRPVRDYRNPERPQRNMRQRLLDSHWRFTTEANFTRPRVRAHIHRNIAEGMSATTEVSRPSIRAPQQEVRAANVMRGRLDARFGPRGTLAPAWAGVRGRGPQPGTRGQPPQWQQPGQPGRGWQPQPQARTWGGQRPPASTWQRPPASTWQQPQQPQRGWQRPPASTWQRPPTTTWQQPQQPQRGWQRPPSSTWQPPQRGTWQQPPQRGWQPPAATRTPSSGSRWGGGSTTTPPSRSWSPPSRSSGSSSYGSPSRSSGSSSYGSSRSSGGSSSYGSSSRSSGSSSYGSSSRSSGSSSYGSSRSSGGSSSSRGSSSGGGGGSRGGGGRR